MADSLGGVEFMADFYQAGTFWVAIAGVLVSLAIGLLAAWISLRSAPKRRLSYNVSDPVSLMTPDGAKHGLEVRRGNQILADPYLVDVTLYSSGRQSITSEMYDGGRPLLLHLNVPIVALLKISKNPNEQAIPKYQISSSTLEVGPDVLAAQQRIIFSLLVDGQPNLEMESHLSDVRIKRQNPGAEQMARRFSFATLGAVTAAAISLFAYTQFASNVVKPPPAAPSANSIPAVLPHFGAVEKTAYNMLPSFGFNPTTQYRCLAYLWESQSGWNYRATNPASPAYGIPQADPGGKMASAGSDWRTNPATQIKWGLGYIEAVYGTPCNAWNFYRTHDYY
jgi:hypothetical protein